MEVVVGTYDEVLIGFRVIRVGKGIQLETDFTDNCHSGCIKCITISSKGILASGGTDETIRLLNIKKRKEVGSLVHHGGTVTSLEFQKSFLFSTSEDKTLCLWKTTNWECLKTLRGHKLGVNCVSVHPSGKLALTVGEDRKLMTWNLITGRSAYITNIKEVAEIVKWSPDGDTYLIVVNHRIDVYDVESAKVKCSINSDVKINCVDFYSTEVCVYGGEGGKIVFHNVNENTAMHTCETRTSRIKGLCVTKSPLHDDGQVLCVGSSDGKVQIHEIHQSNDKISTSLLVDHNASFRITCMAVYHNQTAKDQELEDKPVELLETMDNEILVTEKSMDNKTTVTEKSTSKQVKHGLNIDEEDLDLVAKSLYNSSEKDDTEEMGAKRARKVLKNDKSISFSETVSVVQENDRKEMRKKRRAEILKMRRKARKTEERKNKRKMEKREKGKKFKVKKKEQHV